jgi:hypothetical protein
MPAAQQVLPLPGMDPSLPTRRCAPISWRLHLLRPRRRFTTTALLSAGVELVSTHRDQLDRLMAKPVGWPAALEELLRLVSPMTVTGTTATEDVEVAGLPGFRRPASFPVLRRCQP